MSHLRRQEIILETTTTCCIHPNRAKTAGVWLCGLALPGSQERLWGADSHSHLLCKYSPSAQGGSASGTGECSAF